MMNFSRSIIKAVACGLALTALHAAPQSPDVQIAAHGIHFGGQLIYRYQVINNSASNINAVQLGVSEPLKDLPGAPWDSNPSLTDVPSAVPTSQCKPFQGMLCNVAVYQFDYMLAPRSVIQMGADIGFIAARSTSSVAEVVVPQAQPGYLTGTGTVWFANNFLTDSSGRAIVDVQVPFTKTDTLPPTLSGTASTTKKGHMLSVAVTLTVADNLDPTPAVVLASVTSNQVLDAGDVIAAINTDARTLLVKRHPGRLYYLTYRATDGSENVGSAVITVSAPK